MSQTYLANNTLSLIPGNNGDIQVAVARGRILIDVQAADVDTEGHVRHSHSAVALSYRAALMLRDLIDDLNEPADPRQPALWSDASFTHPVLQRRRRRVHA